MVKPINERSACGWSETRVAGGVVLIENMPDVHGRDRALQKVTVYTPNGLVLTESYVTTYGPLSTFDVPHSAAGACLCSAWRSTETEVEL